MLQLLECNSLTCTMDDMQYPKDPTTEGPHCVFSICAKILSNIPHVLGERSQVSSESVWIKGHMTKIVYLIHTVELVPFLSIFLDTASFKRLSSL